MTRGEIRARLWFGADPYGAASCQARRPDPVCTM